MPTDKISYPIDLGKSPKDLGVSTPEMSAPGGEKIPKKIYPNLYLEWEKPYNFPDEGEMTVRFKKTSEENRKGKDGKFSQRVELDILEILDTEPAEGVEEDTEESTSGILDAEMKKVTAKKGAKYDSGK